MRTDWLCKQLDQLNVKYFREPFMNIVTVLSRDIPEGFEEKYNLVPQKHDDNNQWYKIVIMDHVEVDHLTIFINDLKDHIHAEKRNPLEV
jgi:hypothetical protein